MINYCIITAENNFKMLQTSTVKKNNKCFEHNLKILNDCCCTILTRKVHNPWFILKLKNNNL